MKRTIAKSSQGVRQNQTPFGACIVRDGKVVACSHNRVWKTTDITAHAEIVVIREACRKLGTVDLSDCTIYSTCEPCPMCFSACHWARIPVIVYGARVSDAKRIGFNELQIPTAVMKKTAKTSVRLIGGVMRRENLALFRFWHKRRNKRAY